MTQYPIPIGGGCCDGNIAEFHGPDAPGLDKSLWQLLHDTATIHPDREAVVSLWQEGRFNDCLRWTYRSLLNNTQALSTHLHFLGCRRGMTVAVLLGNSAEWSLLFWVALKMGMTFVPLDARHSNELTSMLEIVTPDIVVVEDEEMATFVDSTALSISYRFFLEGSKTGWLQLQAPHNVKHQSFTVPPYVSDPALIIFTSGTTGNSKGCPHTNQNLVSQTNNFDPNLDATFVDRWLIHTPVCHIFAVNHALRAWRNGGVVVFPSKYFNVGATISALTEEQCTVMSATPTLVKTLLAHPKLPKPEGMSLSVVTMAATSITVGDLQQCREGLGAKDATQAYGMSEGAPIVSWNRQDPCLRNGYHSAVGKVLPGARIRICDPETRDLLQCGQVGELHIGGTSVISQYTNGDNGSCFYTDEHGKWLITGDQAHVTHEGWVYVLGRYKDLIIRGGENIRPAPLEAFIAELPGVEVQVVGVPHPISGQSPVAVVSLPQGVTKSDIFKRAREFGLKYNLSGVFTLEELGFSEMPTTSLGKPKKGVLADSVVSLRENDAAASNIGHTSMLETFVDEWEQLIGVRPLPDDEVRHFADSITILQYCDAVQRRGVGLYFSDFGEGVTVQRQLDILSSRLAGAVSSSSTLIQAAQDSASENSTQDSHISDSDTTSTDDSLKEHKLTSHSDLTLPIRSSHHRMIAGKRPQSFNVRLILQVHKTSNLRAALGRLLRAHPLLRATQCNKEHLVWEDSPRIEESDADSSQIGRLFCINAGSKNMFNAKIARCGPATHLILTFNHSVVDALSLWSFHRNLDLLLEDPDAVLPSKTSYSLFVELYESYKDSSLANQAVGYHVNRLWGISRIPEAIFPSYDGEIHPDSHRSARVVRILSLPDLLSMHSIKPDIFTRCAVILFNVLETSSRHAIFTSWESARSWPFIPPALADFLPNPMDIDGPTVEWVLNLYSVDQAETLLSFMQRVKVECAEMQKHVHAPWDRIQKEMPMESSLLETASYRQSFVWDMSLGFTGGRSQFNNMSLINRYDWAEWYVFS